MDDNNPSDKAESSQFSPEEIRRMEFGQRLNEWILEKGWTQSELARRAALGRDAISTYVRGTVSPTPRSLRAIVNALGIKESDLIPERTRRVMDQEIPSLDIRQESDDPEFCWLRVNQRTTLDQALRIATILKE